MRDPARIEPVLTALRTYWKAYPDLRLGQIVVNASHCNDPFFLEDDALLDRLTRAIAAQELSTANARYEKQKKSKRPKKEAQP